MSKILLNSVIDFIELNILSLNETNLFGNHYPKSMTDTIVSVIDLGGLPPSKYSVTREKKIEIKLRSKGYAEGIELGNKIFNLFHSKENYSLGDFFITSSYASTDLTYLYQDSKNRREFSLELVFQYKK
ncbi:minor capsid protein [Oceanobacillus sp. FSL K6-2867]|uniref:minor capsid protein n=1 Tax=Oceanobacillus sp. FSL K6-2867 TaxID=2954748 RepID=UPI0030DBD6FE